VKRKNERHNGSHTVVQYSPCYTQMLREWIPTLSAIDPTANSNQVASEIHNVNSPKEDCETEGIVVDFPLLYID
jgi:hypothetical protein